MAEGSRPVPFPDLETRPYWEAARAHRLELPKCGQCGRFRFPPKPRCSDCLSKDSRWVEVSGRGTVYTYCVMHDTLVPGIAPPYVVAVVELEEQPGLRLVANILGAAPGDVRIGMAVEVEFQDLNGEIALPQFHPALTASS